MVGKQFAQDRYVMELRLSHLTGLLEMHQAVSIELTTSPAETLDANHYATVSQ